ncbi:MAG TPA: hypothetical protein VF228_22650 [Iamia sp.]
MTTRTAELQVTLRTVPDIVGVTARTVVALPPSGFDLRGAGYGDYSSGYGGEGVALIGDEMRVYVSGVLIWRAYDPELT